METLKIYTFTDESGQDTEGKLFIICTVIIPSIHLGYVGKELETIEHKSKKRRKWSRSDVCVRDKYIELLLNSGILKYITCYTSYYYDTFAYISLTATHIAKSIFDYIRKTPYEAHIFIDKMNTQTILTLKRELTLLKVKKRVVRGISEKNDPFIRLADSLCGCLRDVENKPSSPFYKKLCKRVKIV